MCDYHSYRTPPARCQHDVNGMCKLVGTETVGCVPGKGCYISTDKVRKVRYSGEQFMRDVMR